MGRHTAAGLNEKRTEEPHTPPRGLVGLLPVYIVLHTRNSGTIYTGAQKHSRRVIGVGRDSLISSPTLHHEAKPFFDAHKPTLHGVN